jgi:signal transduction histidine kinase/ligand-binding sensor domain-containing protein/DNA-binding response OmpR family regulator
MGLRITLYSFRATCLSLTIALNFLVSHLQAQHEKNRIIKKYSIEDGLSQAVVNSITQDDKGWMWFATDDGLNRFDGYAFTSFKFDKDSPHPFHDNFVQRLYKDSRGRLWVSSRRGLYRFNISTQKWNVFLHPKEDNNNDVSYISEKPNGQLWIGWYLSGIGTFDPMLEVYDTTQHFPLKSEATIAVFEDSYGLVWAGSQHKGLDVFRLRDGKTEKMTGYEAEDILPSRYVKCFLEDHLGNIWIGTTRGLCVFIRAENRFQVFRDLLPSQCGVFSLLEDKNKKLWIGTQGNGIYTVDLNNFDSRNADRLSSYHVVALDQYDISQHTIRSLFQDRDSNIWIGTHGDGVYMVSHEDKNFMKIQIKRILPTAESFIPFHGLCNDDDGNIWVGTDSEGVYKFSAEGELIKHYPADGKPGSIGDDVVFSALRDYNGELWFGTYAHGVYRYNRRTDSFTHYPHSATDAPVPLGNRVNLLFQDSKMQIWVGASRGGLCLIDNADKTFKLKSDVPVLATIDVRALVEDKKGRLFMGCYGNGLMMYSPETGVVEKIASGTEESNPLKSNIIYALAIDKNNVLWVGTGGGGLGAYDLNNKTFKRFTEEDGLINNTVFALQIDEQQNVWCSTISGISRYDQGTQTFINYTSNDGLQAGQFNPGSTLNNAQKGYMCFGGAYGFNLFYPLQVIDKKTVPDIKLSAFQLFNKTVSIGGDGEDDVLDKVIDETSEIELKNNQASFTFQFTALDYVSPEKIEYAYKLENFDPDWIYVGDQRSASYRYIPPGTYEFKVRATSQNHSWPSKFAHVQITVQPPIWRTPLAYVIYFMIFGLVCFSIISIRKRQNYLKKRVKSERHKRRRERQLVHDKLAFFTEVSHEFKTPLTLIIGPLEEMMSRESGESAIGKKLRMVNKNAHKLLSLINKLLDYRKIESGKMVLTIREIDMVGFIEEIFVNFKELANRPNIRFEFYTQEKSLLTWFDPEKIEMVLTNIISNSFKYIGEGNAISVTLKKVPAGDKEYVCIQVKDNGLGIAKDQLKYVFDWFYNGTASTQISSGIGLALAKKLVYLHKGEIFVESTPGEGSVFTVRIPLGKKHFETHEVIVDHDAVHPETETLDHDHEMDEEEIEGHPLGGRKGLKTILVVEDEEEVRAFLKDYLSTTYRVIDSADSSHALEMAFSVNPDLILSDIMMPGMDGMEFCNEIKHNIKTSHIPVVLLTAKSAHAHHKAGLETGADAYLTKPFSPEILSLTIQNLLQARENSRRYYRTMFFTDEKPEIVSTDEKLLQKIFEIVKMNMTRADLTIDTVSHEVGLSKTILYKKVKQLTGLSPIEYIRSLRLSEAAKLLRTQQYKVYEVVYLVGFSDLKYFRKCFIKEFGYPPSQLLDKQV